MWQEFFHLNSRIEIAHVSPPMVYNVNLCQENTVHRPVVGETRLSTNIRQLIEAVTIPENAITPVHKQVIQDKVFRKRNTEKYMSYHVILAKENYHAGVLLFSLGCMPSPAYRSELNEYLYVGGK